MTEPIIGEMRTVKRPGFDWLTEIEVFDGAEWRPLATSPSDAQLFEEAIASGLITHIRLAAACHPDKIKLEEICSPANAALIVFARNVLARWGAQH
jgi:hypothetical protein